ncbi:Uu.00g115040.m01.CDS01 [Anthostomella pinea]|uniref:Uu.00g115040.m01.CDS01 n=1 Tax=Anthostomella pinea TaxID=933095 RepID=A0AAI8YGL6_9PEZI|nr:Uu.00g115040.m01.CDS01 [Anthostomella pinea]
MESNPITKAMATEEIAAGHRMVGEMLVGAAHKGPKYLQEAGFRCPTDPHDGFMQYAYQTKLNTFQFFASIPSALRDFNLFMGNTMGAREYWVDWFPVQERLLEGATITKESALLVYVGAGRGHDLIAFHARYPRQEGRLVLLDLAPVIDSLQDVDPAIECARSYFYHHILHYWSDSICLEMLEQVKAAMTPSYSK